MRTFDLFPSIVSTQVGFDRLFSMRDGFDAPGLSAYHRAYRCDRLSHPVAVAGSARTSLRSRRMENRDDNGEKQVKDEKNSGEVLYQASRRTRRSARLPDCRLRHVRGGVVETDSAR